MLDSEIREGLTFDDVCFSPLIPKSSRAMLI